MTLMLELAGKNIKEATINIFKDLKEKMVWLSKQMRNLSRGMEAKEPYECFRTEKYNMKWNETFTGRV